MDSVPLEYRERSVHETDSASSIVLLHGFGATADDLYSIAETPAAAPYRVICPQAPKEIRFSGQLMGSAWFPRDDQSLHAALFGGYFGALSTLDPPGLKSSGEEVMALIERLDLDSSALIVGGFSQGAMVAIETAIALARRGCSPRSVVLFSGALIAEERWKREGRVLNGVPVFQSHGRYDPVLALQDGQRLGSLLDSCGCRRQFCPFDGQHGIPDDVLRSAFAFLEESVTS